MNAVRHRLKDEGGIAIVFALISLLVLLLLTAAVVSSSISESSGSRRDTLEKRAFEASQAGLQETLYRLNMLINTSAQSAQDLLSVCTGPQVTVSGQVTLLQGPDSAYGSLVCDPYTESLGNGAFYKSWTTVAYVGTGTCAGVNIGNNPDVAERCVASQGIVCPPSFTTATCPNPVIHRVEERVAAFAGKPIFPLSGVFGLNGVLVENSAQILSSSGGPVVATNKQLDVKNTANITGPASLGPNAGVPIIEQSALLGSAPQCTSATPRVQSSYPTNCAGTGNAYVFSPIPPPLATQVSATDPTSKYLTPDGNARISNAFDSCVSQVPVCPHDQFTGCAHNIVTPANCGWDPTTRTLALINGETWTIGGAAYNLCTFTMQGQSTALLPATQGPTGLQLKTALFVDNPKHQPLSPGLRCPTGTGYLQAGNQAQITNSAPPLPGSPLQHDTTALELYVYGFNDDPDGTYNNNECVNSSSDPRCVLLGQKGNFYGTLYAPNSDVSVSNQGNNYGAVLGSTVVYNNPGTFTQDVNVPTLVTTAVLGLYFRTSWGDCKAQPTVATNPMSGC